MKNSIIIAILLISLGSCTKDRYVLAYDVKIERFALSYDGNSPNPSVCSKGSSTHTIKRGNSVKIDFTGCSGDVQVKVTSGKNKVWYDKTQKIHKETILIK